MAFKNLMLGCAVACFATSLRAEINIEITYLAVETPQISVLSELETPPETLGEDGALTGIADNNTTGKFLGQTYTLERVDVAEAEDPAEAAKAALAKSPYLLVDAPTEALLSIADLPEAEGALIFNVSAQDASLRDTDCRANVLHTTPSYAMRTDALAQFFVKRQWDELVMIRGVHEVDAAYAEAMRNSLTKFGLSLAGEKTWEFDADMRRNAAAEVPVFTQDFGDYDALILADELHDFGRFVLYNTWEPRPVVGSEGLAAETWSAVVEQWGAAQLQNRFADEFARSMQSRDYAAWAAIRSIGEAVTRTGKDDPATLRAFMLGSEFELAGFKGRPLTYRDWNGQLRQPIPLVHPRALAALAPLDGFLHQRTELDTLGLDAPETNCTEFSQ